MFIHPIKWLKIGAGVFLGTTKGNLKHREPVATRTRQIMGYVTVKNIELETGYPQEDWPIFV